MASATKNKNAVIITGALIVLLAASATSLIIKSGIGTCLSLMRPLGQQSTGQFVVTFPCDSSDKNQLNWVVNNLNVSTMSRVIQFCINQTNYCIGIQKDPFGWFDNINLKLVANDPLDPTQQWVLIDSQYMPAHYINGKNGGCIQAYSAYGQGGVVSTDNCRNMAAQQWEIASSL